MHVEGRGMALRVRMKKRVVFKTGGGGVKKKKKKKHV